MRVLSLPDRQFLTGGGINPKMETLFVGEFTVVMVAALIMGALYFVLGSVVSVGYAKFNLLLVDRLYFSRESGFITK